MIISIERFKQLFYNINVNYCAYLSNKFEEEFYMRNLFRNSIAIVLSILMITAGIVPAFAGEDNCTLTISGQAFAGTQKTATAKIDKLSKNDAELIKSGGGLDWSVKCTNISDYDVKIAPTPAVNVSEQNDGTYTVSQNATVSLPSVSDSVRPVIELTATAKSGNYICKQSFTIKIPFSNVDVQFIDDESGSVKSSYDKNSSTLYVDQNYTATFKPVVAPNDNDDSVDIAVTDPADISGTKHVSYVKNDSDNSYTFTVSKNADLISSITFSAASAVGAVKNITLKKCIPLDSFNVIYDNKSYADNQSIPSVVEGDTIKINSTIKPSNSNDEIKYTLYNDAELTQIDNLSTIIPDENKKGCTIIPKGNDSNTKYLKAEAVSMENSSIPRTVSHVVKIPVQQANPITSINFKNEHYTIYTEKNNQIELASELITTPAQNYTDNVYYESADTSIATVDKDKGTVTAKNAGTVTITAHASRGNTVDKTASCTVTVKQAVKSISINIDGFDSKTTPTLTVGHKFSISATKTPSNAEEDIKIYTNDTDYLKIENGIVEAIKECPENVYIKAVSSVTAKEMTIPVKIVSAIRAATLTLQPVAVGKTTLLKDNTQENTYSIYSGETINIEYNAANSDGVKSNDVIEWRIIANSSAPMTIEEAKSAGYITSSSKFTNNILTVQSNSKNNDILTFTAYSLMAGMSTDDSDVVKSSITVYNNTKTNNIKTTTSTSKSMPCHTSFSDTIQLEPFVSTNKDSIYIESTNPNVASVTYTPGVDNRNGSFTVDALSNGVASINIYACSVSGDKSTAVKTKTININVTNNIEYANVAVNDVTYNGSAQTPALTVTFGNIELRKDSDYSVKYENNTNAGQAKVTITGKGQYYLGTKTVYFNIFPASITNANVTIKDQTYSGKALTPAATVSLTLYDNSSKEKKVNLSNSNNKDYTITYQNNINAGTASVVITGNGNYTGTIVRTFNIAPVDINKARFGTIPQQTMYTTPTTPIPTVTYSNMTLTYGIDYVVSYVGNNKGGTAKAIVTGIGNYYNSKELTYTNIAAIPSGAKSVNGYFVNSKYKKANISSLKKGKKSITVKWKKVSGVKGYQIEYSTSKKFTKSTSKKTTVSNQKATSKTVKKLKAKKTYYVRIRTYKTVNHNGKNVNVYSNWSKVKSIKTK